MPSAARAPKNATQPDDAAQRKAAILNASPEEVEVDESLAPASVGKAQLRSMDFFQMLSALTAADWDSYLLYIYRAKSTGIIKSNPKDDWYLEKVGHPIDEDYLKKTFGGGAYTLILNHAPSRRAVRKHTVHIGGEPKLQPGEVDTKGAAKADGGPDAPKSETAMLLQQMNVLVNKLLEQSSKTSGAEHSALTNSISMMQTAMHGALEVQKEGMKQHITSSTGHPLVDKFLETQIAKLGESPKSSISSMKEMAELLTVLQAFNKPSGGLLGNLGDIKETLGLLKELGINIGPGAGGGEGGDWKAALASAAPNVVGMILETLNAWRQDSIRTRQLETDLAARGIIQRTPQQLAGNTAPASRPAAPPNPSATGPQPTQAKGSALPQNFAAGNGSSAAVAGAGQAEPQPEQQVTVNLGFVAVLMRKSYDKGDTGDLAAFLLKRLYDEQLGPYMGYLTDIEQLKGLCAMSDPLKEIMSDGDFPVFLAEFVREMVRRDQEEPAEQTAEVKPAVN